MMGYFRSDPWSKGLTGVGEDVAAGLDHPVLD